MTGSEGGVVGLRGSSLSCFSCEFQVQSCQHVVKLAASEEELVYEMPDFLVDFFAEKCYRASAYEMSGQSNIRKEWTIRSLSFEKISFNLSISQKGVFSSLEEILKSKCSGTGRIEFFPETPSDHKTCPKCSQQCLGQFSRQVPCLLKKMVFNCEGKCFFFFFNTLTCNI